MSRKMFALLYLCLFIMPLAQSHLRIHRLMTTDEVMGVFHTTHDAVPDYELVVLRYFMSNVGQKATAKVRVKAFNQEYELQLNTTGEYLVSEDTPLWTVTSNKQAPKDLQYNLLPDAFEDIGVPMQDENSGAALLVSQRHNERHIFDGFLPSNIVIRSLPKRMAKSVLYGENGLFENHFSMNISTDEFLHSSHHVVYKKVPKKSFEHIRMPNPLSRMNDTPDVIYPEVLAVIDYELYSMLGKNVEQAKRYIVAFWNGVDLRYRAFTNPRIRLNIAGIIISMDEGAAPYIESSRYTSSMLNADKALHAMGSYFYNEKRFPWKMYDVAICNTKLNLCNMIGSSLCDPATLGYAFVAGACNRNQTTKFAEDVGLAEDDGGFSGIIPTAHELGHLLGAHHDGLAQDTKNCSGSIGNIMSGTLQYTQNEFFWSNCSIKALHKFISEDRAKCLYDAPPKATAIRRILPGKLLSPDEQCKRSYGGGSCNKNAPDMCYELKCTIPGTNGLCMPIAAAADGSSCGDGLICLNGACVLKGSETKSEKILG